VTEPDQTPDDWTDELPHVDRIEPMPADLDDPVEPEPDPLPIPAPEADQ
jgi:hypothetical protein